MESWNHSLKVEAIHGERFATRDQAEAHVFEYIEVDYNRTRLHSTLWLPQPGTVRAIPCRLGGCLPSRDKITGPCARLERTR